MRARRAAGGDGGLDPGRCAALWIDVIGRFEFDGGRALAAQLAAAVPRFERLREALAAARVPLLFVNDNLGRWNEEFSTLVRRCQAAEGDAGLVARRLAPAPRDFFVLKPRHSGFYHTALPLLLEHLGVRELIVCGVATDICVAFTANDAHLRGYRIWLPEECAAAETRERHRGALRALRRTGVATPVRLAELCARLSASSSSS